MPEFYPLSSQPKQLCSIFFLGFALCLNGSYLANDFWINMAFIVEKITEFKSESAKNIPRLASKAHAANQYAFPAFSYRQGRSPVVVRRTSRNPFSFTDTPSMKQRSEC